MKQFINFCELYQLWIFKSIEKDYYSRNIYIHNNYFFFNSIVKIIPIVHTWKKWNAHGHIHQLIHSCHMFYCELILKYAFNYFSN